MNTWKSLLSDHRYLTLPSAHDALTARIIASLDFPAYQIGGFARVASTHGYPDVGLVHLDEGLGPIIAATNLPVLVDADNGYGDAKNAVRTVQTLERLGAAAVFIEDQKSPKKCGHMQGKELISIPEMVAKVKAVLDHRLHDETFFIARTDASEEEAIIRGNAYLDAGADGIYVDGINSEAWLRRIGHAFSSEYLATSMMEGGGKTPWMKPSQLADLGYSMILFPTTLLFSATQAMRVALRDLQDEEPMSCGMDLDLFETILGMPYWKSVEQES